MSRPVNFIIEADIKGFFDHVDHGWMMKFLQVCIKDPSLLILYYHNQLSIKELQAFTKENCPCSRQKPIVEVPYNSP